MKAHKNLIAIVLLLSSKTVLANELESSVLGCAKTQDDKQRMACYDAIGQELISKYDKPAGKLTTNDAIAPSPSALTVEEPKKLEVEPTQTEMERVGGGLPEDLGGKQFESSIEGQEKRPELMARGRVTSCKKSAGGKWFFIFANGQIWKQVDSSRRNYRSCNFQAGISKDKIGFKLRVDGENRSIRVRRQR